MWAVFLRVGDRYVVLDSYTVKKLQIWRTDADGGNPTVLAENAVFPDCSPDGKWTVYARTDGTNVLPASDRGRDAERNCCEA